jgi:protein gp37
MINSKIEWTNDTWNFVYGCTHVSEGCRNCYAERVTHRFSGDGMKFEGLTVVGDNGKPRFTGKILMDEKRLEIPLHKKKRTMYFVNSMSDLFHEDVPFEFIDKAFAVMAKCPQHIFQILTKRQERMRDYIEMSYGKKVPNNVWLGVSVEDQKTADKRIPILNTTPSSIRFISYEPALGEIDLRPYLHGLDWVIAGGESGKNRRPYKIEWFEKVMEQCKSAGVPFFMKQLDKIEPIPEHLMVREFPKANIESR